MNRLAGYLPRRRQAEVMARRAARVEGADYLASPSRWTSSPPAIGTAWRRQLLPFLR